MSLRKEGKEETEENFLGICGAVKSLFSSAFSLPSLRDDYDSRV